MSAAKNVIIVGVGGQGVLLASEILATALTVEGFDVKVSEIHGMAQRGGSVHSMVRYGEKIYSPLVTKGEADDILAFELLEGLRWAPYLSDHGKLILNNQRIDPLPVAIGKQKYPGKIIENLQDVCEDLVIVDSIDLAKKAGNIKAANTVLLGVLAQGLPVAKELWSGIIAKRVPKKTVDVNLRAFQLGLEYLMNV